MYQSYLYFVSRGLIGSNNEGNLVLADGRHVLAVTYKSDVPANDAIDADQAIIDFLN